MSIPGLPSLPPGLGNLFSAVPLITGDSVAIGGQNSQQWGVFLNGDPVVIADNVLSMEYSQDFKISNYPVEGGSFSSYNKVQMPAEVRFRFSTGGSSSDRSDMLNSIATVIGDTNLYDVVTPDASYVNFNFVHQNYRRTAQEGAGLLSVDVKVEEVRSASLIVSSTGTATNPGDSTTTSAAGSGTEFDNRFSGINGPQSPSAAPQINGGSVQPVTPTAPEVTQFNNAGSPLP